MTPVIVSLTCWPALPVKLGRASWPGVVIVIAWELPPIASTGLGSAGTS